MADFWLAAAVVVRDDHVLVVRRSYRERFLPGAWGVPCGKLEPAETPQEAVIRELHEETGVTGKVLGFGGRLSFVSEYRGRTVVNEQSNFLVQPITCDVTLPEPDQAYRWVPIADLGSASLDEHNMRTIEQSLSLLAG